MPNLPQGFIVVGCFCFLASLVNANERPVYDEDAATLTLPLVEAEGEPGRFQNAVMEPDGDGSWGITQLNEGVLLAAEHVEEVRTLSTEGLPVQYIIRLSGAFPTACPEVGRISQKREGNTFDVYVYYAWNDWLRDPDAVSCPEAITPFEIEIPLEIYGLQAGDYVVRANGHELRTFTLERDNVAPSQFGSGQPAAHCQFEPLSDSGWSATRCTHETDNTL